MDIEINIIVSTDDALSGIVRFDDTGTVEKIFINGTSMVNGKSDEIGIKRAKTVLSDIARIAKSKMVDKY